MRKPNESLDDFWSSIPIAPTTMEEPLPAKWLRLTGEIEVLKPLVRADEFSEHVTLITNASVPQPAETSWFSGFRRPLALAGSFAIVALVLAAAIFIGTYRPRVELVTANDVAVDQQSKDLPAQADNLAGPATGLSDPLAETDPPSVSEEPRAIRAAIRPHSVASRVLRTFYRSKRAVPKPQIVDSGFVPTTLVIYVEKGEIKTRIEPQLTSSYKKPLTLSN